MEEPPVKTAQHGMGWDPDSTATGSGKALDPSPV